MRQHLQRPREKLARRHNRESKAVPDISRQFEQIAVVCDQLLGLPKLGYGAVVLATAGYRSPEDKHASLPKVRFKTEDVVVPIKMG